MLFIPEGWWHQVDTVPLASDPLALTMAINYWWSTWTASSPEVREESQHMYFVDLLAYFYFGGSYFEKKKN